MSLNSTPVKKIVHEGNGEVIHMDADILSCPSCGSESFAVVCSVDHQRIFLECPECDDVHEVGESQDCPIAEIFELWDQMDRLPATKNEQEKKHVE